MPVKVAIVGRANVGKSTLFNRIIGERISITDDQPGVTRDRIYGRANWLGKDFSLIDTGGIEIKDAPFLTEIRAQAEIAINEADVVVFLTDCRNGITRDDEEVAKILYKSNKPVILAVNKVDDAKFMDMLYEFYALGFGDPIGVSSAHGIGVGDLLDKIISYFPNETDSDYPEGTIKFCLIGCPNVGKSSLANTLIGSERSIVSNIAGTTRDSIDTVFKRDGVNYVVIDTAGIRKRGKVYENAEKYSVLRAVSAVERSNVVLFLLDAEKGIIEQDAHVASYIEEYGRAGVIVVNKWDAVEKDNNTMNKWIDNIRETFKFLRFAPICFISAKDNKRVQTLFPEIKRAYDNHNKRLSTSVLNDCLAEAVAMNPPQIYNKGKARFYYATQMGVEPPTFIIFVNDTEYVHFSYVRYLENCFREAFDFTGTPIKLFLRKRD